MFKHALGRGDALLILPQRGTVENRLFLSGGWPFGTEKAAACGLLPRRRRPCLISYFNSGQYSRFASIISSSIFFAVKASGTVLFMVKAISAFS